MQCIKLNRPGGFRVKQTNMALPTQQQKERFAKTLQKVQQLQRQVLNTGVSFQITLAEFYKEPNIMVRVSKTTGVSFILYETDTVAKHKEFIEKIKEELTDNGISL